MLDLENMYRKKYNSQLKMLTRMLKGDRDRAEDVLQEAYCRAAKYAPTYKKSKSKPVSWFNSIIFNCFRDEIKKDKTWPLRDDIEIDPTNSQHSEKLETLHTMIHNYAGGWNRNYQILFMYYILGYTSSDISQLITNTTVTNVTTICSRFKKDCLG